MTTTAVFRTRIRSIDTLRGIVMVIMALDHTRDYFHVAAMTDQPTNMATTTPALFFTRWITHFCAPIFVFLSGTAAFLNGQKKTRPQLSRFLITRGLWLLVVEVLLVSLILTFDPFYKLIFLEVIWAIGASMILLGILMYLPFNALLAIGLLIFFGHNLLDFPEAARQGKLNLFWSLVHGRNTAFGVPGVHFFTMGYSVLAWTGIMVLGYCCGSLFLPKHPPAYRTTLLLRLGVALIAFFFCLRLINIYGDPVQWNTQKNSVTTFLSFMNVTKYPPSLIFGCMTLGPAMIALSLLENANNRITQFFTVYGSVPLFYFLVHFLLIHLICTGLFFATGHTMGDAVSPQSPFVFRPVQFGYSLPVVYLIWLSVVACMYPLCRRYKNYKQHHRNWWLSYL